MPSYRNAKRLANRGQLDFGGIRLWWRKSRQVISDSKAAKRLSRLVLACFCGEGDLQTFHALHPAASAPGGFDATVDWMRGDIGPKALRVHYAPVHTQFSLGLMWHQSRRPENSACARVVVRTRPGRRSLLQDGALMKINAE